MNRAITLVIDLDGTLYDSTGLDQQNKRAAVETLASTRAISLLDAEKILDAVLSERQESISSSLLSLGVKEVDFEKRQIDIIRPEDVLTPDPELATAIRSAHRRFKTVLFTNTRRVLALRALSAIGLKVDDFDYIFAGGDLAEPKPSVTVLKDILQMIGSSPSLTYTIGDRWKVDHAPGIKLGVTPVLVSGRDDVVRWLHNAVGGSNVDLGGD